MILSELSEPIARQSVLVESRVDVGNGCGGEVQLSGPCGNAAEAGGQDGTWGETTNERSHDELLIGGCVRSKTRREAVTPQVTLHGSEPSLSGEEVDARVSNPSLCHIIFERTRPHSCFSLFKVARI